MGCSVSAASSAWYWPGTSRRMAAKATTSWRDLCGEGSSLCIGEPPQVRRRRRASVRAVNVPATDEDERLPAEKTAVADLLADVHEGLGESAQGTIDRGLVGGCAELCQRVGLIGECVRNLAKLARQVVGHRTRIRSRHERL